MQLLARADYVTGEALSDETITALLTGDHVSVQPGAELVNPDLSAGDDISDDLDACRVARSMYAEVHGTTNLSLRRQLPWGATLIRPYVVLSDAGVTARFDQGAFVLLTPETPVGVSPATFAVYGEDRLHLLNREVGDAYEVADGASYTDAMRQVIVDAGLVGAVIDGTADDEVVPEAMVWPLVPRDDAAGPATWLRILNDLAAGVNYRGGWADDFGRFRSEPYVNPSDRTKEWTFDVDQRTTILGDERTVVEDLWRAPNRWIFVQQNRRTRPTIANGGIYVVDNEHDGPSSQDQRGVWPRQVAVDVANPAALQAYGNRVVAADRRLVTTITASSYLFPVAGHFDVFTYDDPAAGGTRKVMAHEWESDLFDTSSKATRWKWEAV